MLLTLFPPILIPGYPSMLLKSFHFRERKGLEQASTHIVAVCYQFMFVFFLIGLAQVSSREKDTLISLSWSWL